VVKSTWYQSQGLIREENRSISETRAYLRYLQEDLVRSITRRQKSKDGFQGNNNTEAEHGFLQVYGGVRGSQKGQSRTYMGQDGEQSCTYTWVVVVTIHTYVGCSGDSHVHTWVVVVTVTYRAIQDSTGVVSTEGYQIRSWRWKLDCDSRIGWMGFPTTVLGRRESCWC
jgi:hypothetical protein